MTRLPDICIAGTFDDPAPCLLPDNPGKSRELVIKIGGKRFSVPVVVRAMELTKRRRMRARWVATMVPVGPGKWAEPKKKPAKKRT